MDHLSNDFPGDWPLLQVQTIHELRGPNLWTNHPALELWVDLGPLTETASTDVPGFNDRLMAWLPTMIEHRCSVGERGGFFQRLRDGTYPAHILEHVSLELQTLAGTNVGYGRARAMHHAERIYRVVIRCDDFQLARAAVNEALVLIQAAYADTRFDVPAAVARIRAAVGTVAVLDPTTRALQATARTRGIPCVQMGELGLLMMGQGKQMRRIHGTATETTPAVAEEIADDRSIYRPLLESLSVPVPQGERVHSAKAAWEEAESLGLPVIVKPQYRDRGPGISAPLSTREEIEAAFAAAVMISSYVAVEQVVEGDRFELLMIDGRMVAAAAVPDPDPGTVDVPVHDVTDRVALETAQQAADAVRLVGLDVATVVVIAKAIDRPLKAQGGVVRSIEGRPDLSPFLPPRTNQPRPIVELLLERVFPQGVQGRLPLVALAGGPERYKVGRLVEGLLHALERTGIGHAGHGLRLNGHDLHGRFTCAFDATRSLLLNPQLEVAVVEVGRRDVLMDGLGFDRCAVGVVTGLDEHAELPLPGWGFEHPSENLFRAERCVLEVVQDSGTSVLWATNPHLDAMVEKAKGRVLLVGPAADLPALAAHQAAGGPCVYLEAGPAHTSALVLVPGGGAEACRLGCDAKVLAGARSVLKELQGQELGLTDEEALCLAVAAVWALGETAEALAQALAKLGAG